MMTIEEKSRYALELKNNPLFEEMFIDVEKRLSNAWRETLVDQIEIREKMYQSIRCLEELKHQIDGYVNEAIIKKQKK